MGFSETVKSSFVAGLALVAPLVVTLVAAQLVFGWLRGVLNLIIGSTGLASLTGNVEIVAELGALGILLAGIAVLGYLAQRSVGIGLFRLFDRLVGLIPMVSVIYGGVRQVSDALVKRESNYERVVLVEYPREGVYSLGFVTSEAPGVVTDGMGRRSMGVYLPNSPNPTQGHFTLIPNEDLVELEMSVSRAVRLLVTTGIAESQAELEQFRDEEFDGSTPLDGSPEN